MFEEEGQVAFLTRAGAWRVARHGLTMRPLANKKLHIQTALVVRSGNDSRLLSELVRALKRKLDGPSPRQMTLQRSELEAGLRALFRRFSSTILTFKGSVLI